jgi:hypothetical protein
MSRSAAYRQLVEAFEADRTSAGFGEQPAVEQRGHTPTEEVGVGAPTGAAEPSES